MLTEYPNISSSSSVSLTSDTISMIDCSVSESGWNGLKVPAEFNILLPTGSVITSWIDEGITKKSLPP